MWLHVIFNYSLLLDPHKGKIALWNEAFLSHTSVVSTGDGCNDLQRIKPLVPPSGQSFHILSQISNWTWWIWRQIMCRHYSSPENETYLL